MARATGGRKGKPAGRQLAKVTIRIDQDLATRLAVESAMRHISMGAIVEEVIGPHLRKWRLPSNVDVPGAAADPAENAA